MEIFVSRWSLRKSIARRALQLTALPEFVVKLGFDGLELTELELRGRRRRRLLSEQCRVHHCGLIVDVNSDLTLDDPAASDREIAHVSDWLEWAAQAGIRTVRITLGGQGFSIQRLQKSGSNQAAASSDNGRPRRITASYPIRRISHILRVLLPVRVAGLERKIERAIDALRVLTPRAEALGVRMGIENHWGISTRPAWVLRVVEEIDSPFLGTCPDFGNFPRSLDPYMGLAKLLPRAVHVQAKSWSFDAMGEETTLDYARCLALVRQAGYSGPITIEYEGGGDDLRNCLRTRHLIERCWSP